MKQKAVVPVEESFFDVMGKYLSTHKLSEPRKKNFKVIVRSLRRFELYRNRISHIIIQLANFCLNKLEVFITMQAKPLYIFL
jgi:hypothetical protein